MIILHHLNNSRSQRILWLLEELNLPYRIECYQRDARTNLAPPQLRAVHPLGKSPVIQDGDPLLPNRVPSSNTSSSATAKGSSSPSAAHRSMCTRAS